MKKEAGGSKDYKDIIRLWRKENRRAKAQLEWFGDLKGIF